MLPTGPQSPPTGEGTLPMKSPPCFGNTVCLHISHYFLRNGFRWPPCFCCARCADTASVESSIAQTAYEICKFVADKIVLKCPMSRCHNHAFCMITERGVSWYSEEKGDFEDPIEQDVLPCALTLTAYIQFPLMFLFGLFCRPFGGQKPSSVVDHGSWFFKTPDLFSCNVIRNYMICYFQYIWSTGWSELCQYRRNDSRIWSNIYSWYFAIDCLCDIRLWIDQFRLDPVRTHLVHGMPAI
jgi:hypothetical protein